MLDVIVVDSNGIKISTLKMHCLPRVGDKIQFVSDNGTPNRFIYRIFKVGHMVPENPDQRWHRMAIHIEADM